MKTIIRSIKSIVKKLSRSSANKFNDSLPTDKKVHTSEDSSSMYTICIGNGQCLCCDYEWEALAYKDTLDRIECPLCDQQKSAIKLPQNVYSN